MRLIDADAFKEWLMKNSINERELEESRQIGMWIDSFPSAESRKKGKWIKLNNSCTIRCNQCGQEMTSLCDIQLPNYCPNCGSYNGGKEE